MPYIKQERRDAVRPTSKACAATAGELNFQITKLCNAYIQDRPFSFGYSELNEVVGVLECVKLELYRRLAVPYEDKKCLENGDVFNTTK